MTRIEQIKLWAANHSQPSVREDFAWLLERNAELLETLKESQISMLNQGWGVSVNPTLRARYKRVKDAIAAMEKES